MMGLGGMGVVYMLIFWVLVIGLAVWLLSNLFPREANNTSSSNATWNCQPESPLEILKQRYARGELSKDEYEAMRRDLDV